MPLRWLNATKHELEGLSALLVRCAQDALALSRLDTATHESEEALGDLLLTDLLQMEHVLTHLICISNTPDPPPRYDAIYRQGVEWLDSLASSDSPDPITFEYTIALGCRR